MVLSQIGEAHLGGILHAEGIEDVLKHIGVLADGGSRAGGAHGAVGDQLLIQRGVALEGFGRDALELLHGGDGVFLGVAVDEGKQRAEAVGELAVGQGVAGVGRLDITVQRLLIGIVLFDQLRQGGVYLGIGGDDHAERYFMDIL